MNMDKILLENDGVCLYKIPVQSQPTRCHRAKDWDLGNPWGTFKLTLLADGERGCHLLFKDDDDALFGECVVDCYCPTDAVAPEDFPPSAVNLVSDSSRYFTVKLHTLAGEYELVGLGFSSRRDSSDFTQALDTCFRTTTLAPTKKPKSHSESLPHQPTSKPKQSPASAAKDRSSLDVKGRKKTSPSNNSKSPLSPNAGGSKKLGFECEVAGCKKGFRSAESLSDHMKGKHGKVGGKRVEGRAGKERPRKDLPRLMDVDIRVPEVECVVGGGREEESRVFGTGRPASLLEPAMEMAPRQQPLQLQKLAKLMEMSGTMLLPLVPPTQYVILSEPEPPPPAPPPAYDFPGPRQFARNGASRSRFSGPYDDPSVARRPSARAQNLTPEMSFSQWLAMREAGEGQRMEVDNASGSVCSPLMEPSQVYHEPQALFSPRVFQGGAEEKGALLPTPSLFGLPATYAPRREEERVTRIPRHRTEALDTRQRSSGSRHFQHH